MVPVVGCHILYTYMLHIKMKTSSYLMLSCVKNPDNFDVAHETWRCNLNVNSINNYGRINFSHIANVKWLFCKSRHQTFTLNKRGYLGNWWIIFLLEKLHSAAVHATFILDITHIIAKSNSYVRNRNDSPGLIWSSHINSLWLCVAI